MEVLRKGSFCGRIVRAHNIRHSNCRGHPQLRLLSESDLENSRYDFNRFSLRWTPHRYEFHTAAALRSSTIIVGV